MDASTRRNAVVNIVGEGLWGLQAAMIASATVLTIILKQYGAGTAMISSIMTVEAVGLIMPQMIGVYLFRRRSLRKVPLVIWHFATIIPLTLLLALLLKLAPVMPPGAARWLILGCYACMMVSIGVIISVWMDWIAGLFDTKIRGTVMGLAFGVSALAGVLGTLFSGRLMGSGPGPGVYPLIYLCAGITAALSIGSFLFVKDKPLPFGGSGDLLSVKMIAASVKQSLSERNFRRFLTGRILAAAGFAIMPFITLYYLSARGGGLAADLVVTVSVAQTMGTTAGNVALGRAGDRFGHRIGLVAGAAAQILALALLLTTSGVASCAAVFFLAGICMSAGFVSHYNMLFETCPHNARAVHITAGNFVFSLGAAAFPILGGLAASRFGLPALFAVSLAVSCCAGAWYLLYVKEPRDLQDAHGAAVSARPD